MVMGKLIRDGLIRGWGLSQVDVDVIDRAHAVTPLSAVQNIYSMLERGVEEAVIPYCLAQNIGLVPFSPIASGFLSGKVTAGSDFSHSDDVRKFVPQLREVFFYRYRFLAVWADSALRFIQSVQFLPAAYLTEHSCRSMSRNGKQTSPLFPKETGKLSHTLYSPFP